MVTGTECFLCKMEWSGGRACMIEGRGGSGVNTSIGGVFFFFLHSIGLVEVDGDLEHNWACSLENFSKPPVKNNTE